MYYAILVYNDVYEIVSENILEMTLNEYIEEFGDENVDFIPWN